MESEEDHTAKREEKRKKAGYSQECTPLLLAFLVSLSSHRNGFMLASFTSSRTIRSTRSNRFMPLASPPLASYSATLVMPRKRTFRWRLRLASAISSCRSMCH